MKTERIDDDFLYKKIQDALNGASDNFNVLEEQIDVQLQAEYFEFANKFREGKSIGRYRKQKDQLLDQETEIRKKKKILVALATSVEVGDFRLIELYSKNPDPELKEWSILALQESRMLLQSSLLDEQQVFISTGLGGKGQKLRYFVVFMNRNGGDLTDMQKKLLHDELAYALENGNGELEEMSHLLDFNTALVILPLTSPLRELFQAVIEECNQYGDFLEDDMVITNVKRLNAVEIIDLLQQQKELGDEETDSLEDMPDDEDE